MSAPRREAPAELSPLWFVFLYGIALFPCFGTALVLVFPIGRMRRIWRGRGLPEDEQLARWERLRFHKWVAFGLSLAVWAATVVVPFLVGVGMRLVDLL